MFIFKLILEKCSIQTINLFCTSGTETKVMVLKKSFTRLASFWDVLIFDDRGVIVVPWVIFCVNSAINMKRKANLLSIDKNSFHGWWWRIQWSAVHFYHWNIMEEWVSRRHSSEDGLLGWLAGKLSAKHKLSIGNRHTKGAYVRDNNHFDSYPSIWASPLSLTSLP